MGSRSTGRTTGSEHVDGLGQKDPYTAGMAHQLPETDGGVPNPPTFLGLTQAQAGSDTVRQHDHRCLLKQRGWGGLRTFATW